MYNAVLAVLFSIPLAFASCTARADEHRLGSREGPNISVTIPEHDRDNNRHVEVHRRHFNHYRHGRSEFGVVFDTPWTPYEGYPYHRAWCPNPEGFYPDVQVCVQPWVRITD